jgi:ribonuclease HI
VQREGGRDTEPLFVAIGKADDTMPTTHQPMEVTAAMMAVQWLLSYRPTVRPTIISDSFYVVESANKWYLKWEDRNWRTSSGKPVKYPELWRPLLATLSEFHPRPTFVHTSRKGNEKTDTLCTMTLKSCHPDCTADSWDKVANAVRRAFEDWPAVFTEHLIAHFEKVHSEGVNVPQGPHVWQFPLHTD